MERLAAPERDGVAYLREIGSYPSLDELALTFDDELGRVRNVLPSDHPLLLLDKELDEMSGEKNAALWQVDALNAQPWIVVRQIARDALAELDHRLV